jgi:hypothetical protein
MPAKSDTVSVVEDNALTEETISVDELAGIVSRLANSVNQLAERVTMVSERPQSTMLPIAPNTEDMLSNIRNMKKGEARSGTEYTDLEKGKMKFRPDDIVQLVDEEKLSQLQSRGVIEKDAPLYGVVRSIMYVKRKTGVAKYKVDFGRPLNEDGIMEDDLVHAQ